MMALRAIAVGLVTMALLGIPLRATAQEAPLPLVELLADPTRYSGEGVEVTLEGELVGDYGRRRDGWTWAQLNDDPYADRALLDGGTRSGANVGVAIRMPHRIADELGPPGGYRRVGPVVRVTGSWRFHDADQGGESYVEVTDLAILSTPRTVTQSISWPVAAGGLALLVAAAALWRRGRLTR